MSVDVERDIRAYAAYLDEILPTVTADDVRASTVPTPLGPPRANQSERSWYRRPVTVFSAAVVVMIFVMVPVLLFPLSGDIDSPSTVPALEPSATPATISGPDPGDVTVHNSDLAEEGDPWVGMVVESGEMPNHDYIMLAAPTGPADLNPGEGTGMYLKGAVYVLDEWGTPGRPPNAPELIATINNPSPEAATKEVLWLAWRGGDAQAPQYEIQAALEHDVTEGFRLHPECYVVDTFEFAAALTDKDLVPVEAWKIGTGHATFEETDPSQVKCEASITEWLYEYEFNTRP